MERLTHAATVLKAAAEEINVTLSKDDPTINTFVQAQLAKVISRLGFYTGIPSANAKVPEFKPVTKFMGAAINPSKALTAADLKPAKTEVHQLATKVNKLYDMIQDFTPDVVLNSYANAANEVVLRGVAKKAGIQDYDTVELNVPLIDQIVASKEAAAQKTADDADIEAALAAQEKLFSEQSTTADADPVNGEETENEDDHDDEDGSEEGNEDQIVASKEAAAQKTAPKKKGGAKK